MFFAKSDVSGWFLSRLRRMSIRSRLALQYAAVLSLTLLAYGIFVNVLLTWSVWDMIDRDLKVEAQELERTLNLRPDISLAAQSVTLPDVASSLPPDTLVQIIDAEGNVVARTINLQDRSALVGDRVLRQALAGNATYVTLERRGLWLRVYLMPLSRNGQIIGLVWIARSLEALGAALDRLQSLLLGVGVLALLSSGVWSKMLTRSALKMVDDLTRTAHRIAQTQDASQRVAYVGPPDEIGRLATTFNEMLTSLDSAQRRTESVLTAQRRFVADASHELRTPLTSLRGNVGILRRTLSTLSTMPADTLNILTDVDDELTRLSRLVDGLLTLARADAGQRIVKSPVDLGEIVQSVFRQTQNWTSPVALDLEIKDPVKVSGSTDHLTQLLLILLDNAIAYTPSGGKVTVSLRRENGDAVLSVADTGIGIDPDDVPHIFDRFYRSRAARVVRGEGAGLGLAIARWIVNEHGGQITVKSEVGKGSRFAVRFPANIITSPHS